MEENVVITNEILGSGSYGDVFKGTLRNKDRKRIDCAVKIMKNKGWFSGFHNFNEIEILTKLGKNCDFIIKLIKTEISPYYIRPENQDNESKKEQYFRRERAEYLIPVFELAKFDGTTFFFNHKYSFEELKLMCSQVLLGVDHMNRRGICHRDLKSSNLLVFFKNGKPHVKIGDFGFSTVMPFRGERDTIVQTIWYRAPEVMFKVNNYEMTCDNWSCGVIFMEMFLKRNWFKPVGKNPTKSSYMEFCIENICDEWTVDLQEMYREYSDDRYTRIYDDSRIRSFEDKVQESYLPLLKTESGSFNVSDEELSNFSSLLKEFLTFDYMNRKGAYKILKTHTFFNSISDYVREKFYSQHGKLTYDKISFDISESVNNEKVDYFNCAVFLLEVVLIRHFFYALDLANRILTFYRNFDTKDVCAASLYFIHKIFSLSKCPMKPQYFFFHKFDSLDINLDEYENLDKFIYDFEHMIATNIKKIGYIIRPSFFDFQNSYKSKIEEHEKHDLSREQLLLLFEKLCNKNSCNDKSYRRLYREFYKQYIDENFSIEND